MDLRNKLKRIEEAIRPRTCSNEKDDRMEAIEILKLAGCNVKDLQRLSMNELNALLGELGKKIAEEENGRPAPRYPH